MLIVLEGADGTGKSTLAAELAEHLGTEVLHFGPPEDHPLAEYQLPLDGYRAGAGQHVVVDRMHWSQEVYGPLHRGECILGREGMAHMDLYLRSRGAFFVLLTDWPAKIRERMLSRGDQGKGDPPPEDLQHLVARYWELHESTTLPHDVIQSPDLWARHDLHFEGILNEAAIVEADVAHLSGCPNYAGGPDPDVLLLGDTREGANKKSAAHEAAFAPYPTCSGAYLLRALGDEAVNVGLANANEVNIAQLHAVLGRPPVVALGANAKEAARNQGFQVTGVAPHPQYFRRFHHHKPDVYRRLIAEAIAGGVTTSWER